MPGDLIQKFSRIMKYHHLQLLTMATMMESLLTIHSAELSSKPSSTNAFPHGKAMANATKTITNKIAILTMEIAALTVVKRTV